MQMKEVLNVYQNDWASTPSMRDTTAGELRPDIFKNKTVLISGHAAARALAYTVLMMNDRLKLGAKVILASTEQGFENTVLEGAAERDDLTFCELSRISGIKQKVDLIIHTGLCCTRVYGTIDEFSDEIGALSALSEFAVGKKITDAVLLSDSRIYGKGSNKFRAFAETELGSAPVSDYKTQLLRTIESTFSTLCERNNIRLTTLRTGIILAPGSGISNGLERVFDAVAGGREVELYSTDNKLSFVYLSDVTNAIVYLLTKKLTGVFNIQSGGGAASTGMIAAKLHDIFGSQAKIKMTEQGSFEGNELNCGKLLFNEFKPSMTLDTALELSVHSYMEKRTDKFRFPHEHYGRLDAIQQVLIAYLLEVDRICSKHNIKWFLGGGTMLGAARHKGFIPWDDDVDIMMLREDYDKFLEVAPDELPDGMILQDPKKDKTYNYAFAKLRLTGTMFATDFSKNHKGMDNGFAFDIFCHDKTANSKLGQKIHSKLTLFWLAVTFNKWNHRKADNGSRVQSAITNLVKNILPLRFSTRMLMWTLEMFKHKRHAKYLYDGMGKSVHKGGFDKSWLDEVIRVDFCGYKMPVPAKYREYLRNHYGDYMELSPLSTRIMGHEITLSDLQKYSDFRISNIPPKPEKKK